jgi:hypothetical protein
MGPEKGRFFFYFTPCPAPVSVASSTSNLCHFNTEDADCIFIRIVGIDLRNHMAPKPKTISSSSSSSDS